MSFGKNLQHLRRLSGGMTQEALAEKMEVSRQTVSKWELDQALPEGVAPEGWEILSQGEHKYAAITIASPFENPFTTIPNAYKTLMDYMRLNGYAHSEDEVIPCFETAGKSMDIYIACK